MKLIRFNAAGQTLSRPLGNGGLETFGYNSRLQQTSISASLSSTALMSLTYDYGTSSMNTATSPRRSMAFEVVSKMTCKLLILR